MSSLEDRELARSLAVEKLSDLPAHEGLGVAMGIAVDLAKRAGLDADRFVACAYVAFEHVSGTEEEAIEAMRKALAAARAARARTGR
jgi:hypothetical protein